MGVCSCYSKKSKTGGGKIETSQIKPINENPENPNIIKEINNEIEKQNTKQTNNNNKYESEKATIDKEAKSNNILKNNQTQKQRI